MAVTAFSLMEYAVSFVRPVIVIGLEASTGDSAVKAPPFSDYL
jgi:hypothetical protein